MNHTTKSRLTMFLPFLLAIGFVGCQPSMEEPAEEPAMEAPAADSAAMEAPAADSAAMDSAAMEAAAADSAAHSM